MSDIVLTAGVRANLLQLQKTSDLITSTQTKLATGRRINTALDNPVAFFTDNKPVKGKPEFVRIYKGATYQFASKEHRDLFAKDSAKYEPAFGGYCAYGLSKGKLVEIDVDAFQIVDGRLLLQYSKGVRDDFNKDTKGNLAKAEANWPGLVEKKGK